MYSKRWQLALPPHMATTRFNLHCKESCMLQHMQNKNFGSSCDTAFHSICFYMWKYESDEIWGMINNSYVLSMAYFQQQVINAR